MKTVNLGILGCANIVEKHIIEAFKGVKNGKIITIASRDGEKAKAWSKKINCEYDKSYEDLLERKDIDAVYIPLPIGLHREWVIKAAKAKKHIICEKSLTDSFSAAKEMVNACKKNKVVLYENFMCNYHPQHQRVEALISDGTIGDVHLFKGFFGFPPLKENSFVYKKSLGGGSLNETGTYPVFMSRKTLKSEPLSVTCSLFYDKIHDADIRGSAYMEFQKNKSALISFGFDNMYQNNYSVWGSTGLINVDRAYSIPADMKPQIELIKQNSNKKIDAAAANHFTLIFNDFFNSILEKRKIDYSSILSQARVMEALRISAKKDKKVKVDSIN